MDEFWSFSWVRAGSVQGWKDVGAGQLPHGVRPHQFLLVLVVGVSGNAGTDLPGYELNHRPGQLYDGNGRAARDGLGPAFSDSDTAGFDHATGLQRKFADCLRSSHANTDSCDVGTEHSA